ncbi:MAG: NAD-dependent epimerase/dehydratase family protein [Saprospiraceae bacterium]|jgi:nucleoside-diphosphate-sugar epimerase|nr:NAD-dependent epimerase/dehydratase family protein [Saprospiraceae bacterium]MBP9210796.1 NAD-dependent epimerase/dehydratase family protein [Saprospiraceae bacterium]MBV6472839.1 GDP-L-fucose synthase [Saprospiraceae bacterium]
MDQKTLLVTGATGFVGYHIVNHAVQQGFSVVATCRTNSPKADLDHLPIFWANVSLFDESALSTLIADRNVQYIVHNAGLTRAKRSEDYYSVNAHSTRILAQAARRAGEQVKKFVLVSSLAAQGPGKHPQQVLSVMDPEEPVTHYGKSKLMAEKLLLESGLQQRLVFRPTGVYGPRDRDFLEMIRLINRGIELYLGRGPQSLSFVYVCDLARLLVEALESPYQQKTYLVADGRQYDRSDFGRVAGELMHKNGRVKIQLPVALAQSVAALAECFAMASKGKPPILSREKIIDLVAPSWACDPGDSFKDFNFTPQFDLQGGLAQTIAWYKSNAWL